MCPTFEWLSLAKSYIGFDFHEECKNMRYENLDKLVAKSKPFLEQIRHTFADPTGIAQQQTGIIRTNCIDCLDRTNVVQVGGLFNASLC